MDDHTLQHGLPETVHSLSPATEAHPWPRQAEVEAFFGPVGGGQAPLLLPFPLRLAWETTRLVPRISLHRKVHASAARCFEQIAAAYDADARHQLGLDLFGGSFNVRKMRGGERWSLHAWGIAIDFDPLRNNLRSTHATARLAHPDCEAFWQIWEREGWISLGRSRDYDWMHVQAARL